jgi:hypothetical protein
MPHAAWKQELIRKALANPGGPGSLGIRAMASKVGSLRNSTLHIDPSDYGCSRLAAQLADEWVEYVAATQITSWAATYRRAINNFCKAMDVAFGSQAQALTLTSPELADGLIRWERALPEKFATGSKWPGFMASALHILIVRRDDHADRSIDPLLARLARGPVLISWGESSERDEFKRAEKRAMVRAAWKSIRAMEDRIAAGRASADQGQHPDQGSWTSVPDLLWGLSREEVGPADIRAALPPLKQWPDSLRTLVARPDGTVCAQQAKTMLSGKLIAQLYPTTLDLHPFRVLLIDATGHAPEEVTRFGERDVEFLPKGVRLTLLKNRAERLRHRAFRDAPVPAAEPRAEEF